MNATSYFILDEKEKMRYASISEDGPELSEVPVSYEQLYRQNGGILTVYGENHTKLFAAPIIWETAAGSYAACLSLSR